jgi:4a-hydroxytetrahydrobiopterin dehydratase
LKGDDLDRLIRQLDNGWDVADGRRIEKTYLFKNFRDALAFTNRVGAIAEEQGHHPDIRLAWGKVKLSVWTHKIGGLTESDIIFAARADTALSVPAEQR